MTAARRPLLCRDKHHGVSRGIIGMRERAALFGGDVHAGPAPGGGWQVTARLPVTWGGP